MIRLFLTMFFAAFAAIGGARDGRSAPSQLWAASYGAATDLYLWKVVTDDAGNSYAYGRFGRDEIKDGGGATVVDTRAAMAAMHVLVVKMAPDGSRLWARTFGVNWGSFGDIAVDGEGNVHLTGSYSGTSPELGLPAAGGQDGFVAKLNADGDFQWSKSFRPAATGLQVEPMVVAAGAGGDVFVAGSASASLSLPAVATIGGGRQTFLFKFDAAGNPSPGSWPRVYGGNGAFLKPWHLAVLPGGEVQVAGNFASATIELPVVPTPGVPTTFNRLGVEDTLLMRIDTVGDVAWARVYGGGTSTTFPTGMALDSSGAVYLTARHNGPLGNPVLPLDGFADGMLIKVGADGTTAWSRNYGVAGGAASTSVDSVTVDRADTVTVAGRYDTAVVTGIGLPLTGARDVFTIGYDILGNQAVAPRHHGGAGVDLRDLSVAAPRAGAVVIAAAYNADMPVTTPTPAIPSAGINNLFLTMWGAPRVTLSVSTAGDGTVTFPASLLPGCSGACTRSVDEGTSLTLTAVPGGGATFAGWGGACAGTNPSVTLVLTTAQSCVASFADAAGGAPAPTPVQPPSFLRQPVPSLLELMLSSAGPTPVPVGSSFTGLEGLTVTVSGGDGEALPPWLTLDRDRAELTVSLTPPNDFVARPSDARPGLGNAGTIFPPLYIAASTGVTIDVRNAAGERYSGRMQLDLAAPRSPASAAMLSLSREGAVGDAPARRPAVSWDGAQIVFDTAATNLFPHSVAESGDIVRYHGRSGNRDRLSQTAVPGGGVANAAAGRSLNPAVAADGSLAAFASDAAGLSATPAGGRRQVYATALAYPRVPLDESRTPAAAMISARADGTAGNGVSDRPAVSRDGRYVVFESTATNFADGLDGTRQVWRKDRRTGDLRLVSRGAAPGNAASGAPSISWDGRYVAFESMASNLVTGIGGAQVYLADIEAGTIAAVSSAGGRAGNGASVSPQVDARGERVAFATTARNLGFANDRGASQVVVAEVGRERLRPIAEGDQPSLSADGRFVAFRSTAALKKGMRADGPAQAWIHDIDRGAVALASRRAMEEPAGGRSWAPALSGDGTMVAFASDAGDLVAGSVAPGQVYLAANLLPLADRAGVWYLPDGGGQAWAIERWGDRAYVAGLAYDAAGRPRWAAGLCRFEDLVCRGGLADWRDGNAAGDQTVSFALAGGSAATLAVGADPARKLAAYPIGGASAAALPGLPEAGWWYEPGDAGSGRGYFLAFASHPQADGTIRQMAMLSVLSYDARGNPVWYAAEGALGADLGLAATLQEYRGGAPLGTVVPVGRPQGTPVGPVRVTFPAPDRAELVMPGGGRVALARFRF